ncbi:MAG: hypothetical protein KAI39_00915 [Desulfobulbaceae bacterium]|nr:hypothetical protein [Desulfobulbaceae bacterium]
MDISLNISPLLKKKPRQKKRLSSCPDWASMCKHVAATLYGVGARLDEEPALFFTLRQAAIDDLVSQAAKLCATRRLAGIPNCHRSGCSLR